MQLQDLVKPLEQLTDDELRQKLQEIRHKRNHIKPAAKAHAKKAVKKGSQGRVSKVEDMFAGMSEADKQALLVQLQQGELNV